MKITQAQIAAVFDEWKRLYTEDPSSFQGFDMSDENYGSDCAEYFTSLAAELFPDAAVAE